MKLSIGVKSFAVQIASFFACIISLALAHRLFGFTIQPVYFLLVCGLLAATISYLLQFDWWWMPIQFLFSPFLYVAYGLQIPSAFYFIAMLFCALVFWSTYRTQVPYYPSRASLIAPISNLLRQTKAGSFIDLGSGLGGLLFRLEEQHPSVHFFGIEIAPLPYWYSLLRRAFVHSNVKFVFGSYFHLDLSNFDVVFCYLSPAAMPAIWEKACIDMKPGSLLLSYEFIVPQIEPSFVLEIDENGPLLYGWRI